MLAGAVTITAIAVIVFATNDIHAAIRATARMSAVCTAVAFARVRVRESSALIPFAHGLHYALIIAAGQAHHPLVIAGGAFVYAVMAWNAIRPNTIAIYFLWILFLLAFVINAGKFPIRPVIAALLLLAAVARWLHRERRVAVAD